MTMQNSAIRAMRKQARVLYRDDRFVVTNADIRTPSAYYPIGDTVGHIRRDILFCSLGYTCLTGAALIIYADLWYPHELAAMLGSIVLAILIGRAFAILQLDARGFPCRLFVARRKTVQQIFEAITGARATACRSAMISDFEDED